MATDHAGRDDPPLPLYRLRPDLAPRHHEGRRTAGEADPRRPALGLEGIVVQHLTVARVAEGLGVAWDTANDAVLAEGRRVLIDDEHRFDEVTAIGVDEHVWITPSAATST